MRFAPIKLGEGVIDVLKRFGKLPPSLLVEEFSYGVLRKDASKVDSSLIALSAVLYKRGCFPAYLIDSMCLCEFLDQAVSGFSNSLDEAFKKLFARQFFGHGFSMHCPDHSAIFYTAKFYENCAEGDLIFIQGHGVSCAGLTGRTFSCNWGADSLTPKLIKRALALGLYLECFPEAFSDVKLFPFSDMVPMGFDKKPSQIKSIGVAKEIAHRGGHSISPHFRQAHFKRLDSDFYVNKRGKVILVRGCFVKGKATLVEDVFV